MYHDYKIITNQEELSKAYQEAKNSEHKRIIGELIHSSHSFINNLLRGLGKEAWVCNILDKEGESVHVMTTEADYAVDFFTNDYDMEAHDFYVVPFEYAYRNDGAFGIVRLDNSTSMWFEHEYKEA